MPCYHPLSAYRTPEGIVFSALRRHDIIGNIELPCGQCIGCRMRRASDWELRVMHEASMWEQNCFITLTYGDGNLPPHGSLCYRDYQLFMKRLRRAFPKRTIRFYMCGEYGEQTWRPHYHACLFNVEFEDQVPIGKSKSGFVFYTSKRLEALWGLGHVTVQPLVKETASYTARYIMKKVLGDAARAHYSVVDEDGVMHERQPEFAVMSLRPGIGAKWFDKFGGDVFPMDAVILDGVKRQVPKFYDRRFKRRGDFDAIEFERSNKARKAFADNTDERRQVRETVHVARVRNLKRDI